MFEEEPLPLESELWDMPEVGPDHMLYADVLLLSAGGNHTPCVWSEPTRGGVFSVCPCMCVHDPPPHLQCAELFVANLRLFLAGKELPHQLEWKRGY